MAISSSLFAGMERISFQPKSAFAKDLVKCVGDLKQQRVQFFKDNPKLSEDTPDGLRQCIAHIDQYAEKVFAPEMRKLAKKHLNIRIQNIYLQSASGAAFFFAMIPCFKKGLTGEDLVEFNLGTKNPDNAKKVDEYLAFVGNAFNGKTSRFDKDVSSVAWMHLLFDVGLAVMGDKIVPDKIVEPLTTEELAAILAHEFGHMVSILEYSAQMYTLQRLAGETIPYLVTKADSKQVEKAKETLKKAKTEVKEYPYVPGYIVTLIIMLIQVYLQIIFSGMTRRASQVGETPTSEDLEEEHRLGVNAYLIFAVIFNIIGLNQRLPMAKTLSDKKQGDTVQTMNWRISTERRADEFASMHGFSLPLGSALEKFYKYSQVGYLSSLNAENQRSTVLAKVMLTIGSLFDRESSGYFLYGPELDRLKNLAQDNYNILKDQSLPDDVRRVLIEDTKELLALIDRKNSVSVIRVRQVLGKIMDRVKLNFSDSDVSVVNEILTGNLTEDYRQLENITEGLIKSPLYYQAARLKSIAKK